MEVAPSEATSVEATVPEQEKLAHLNNTEMSGDDQTKSDIDKAAEQMLNDWSERLQDSAVFTEPDEEDAGQLSNSLAAGAFEEVIMGYDDEQLNESEEEIVEEEEFVDESFSEEVLEDEMMDDNDLQEHFRKISQMMDDPADNPEEEPQQQQQQQEEQQEEAVELTLQDSQPSDDSVADNHNSREPLLPPPPPAAAAQDNVPNNHSSENEPSYHSAKQVVVQDTTQGVHQAHNDPNTNNNDDSQPVEYVDETVYEEEKQQEASEPEIDTTQPKDNTEPYMQQFEQLQEDDLDLEAQQDRKKQQQQPGKPEAAKQPREEQEDSTPTFLYVLIGIVCLVVIALAVVLPLLFLNKDDDDDEAKVPVVTDFPTLAPTVATPAPTRLSTGWVESVNPVYGPKDSQFGASIALHGDYSAVGAPLQNGTLGAAYGFHYGDLGWNIPTEVLGKEEGAMFGAAIDLLDEQMVVGAPNTKVTNTLTPAGSAFLFAHNPESNAWEQLGPELRTEETILDANSEFGSAVAIGKADLPRVVIGAPKASLTFESNFHGRVYTYENSRITWNALESSPLYGKNANDWYGSSVDMTPDGSHFIVGAPGEDAAFPGYFEIYEYQENDWSVVYQSAGDRGEKLGSEVVSLAGNDVFAVGGPGYQNGAGRVVVYQKQNEGYGVIGEIVGKPGERIGGPGTIGGGIDDDGLVLIVATALGDVLTYGFVEEENHWIQRVEPFAADTEVIAFSVEQGLMTSDPNQEMVSLFETGDIYVTGKVPEPLKVQTISPTVAPVTNAPTDAPVVIPVTEAPVASAPVESPTLAPAVVVDTPANSTEATSSPTAVPQDDENGSSLTWSETAGPFLPKPDDAEYGYSLSLSANTLAIGAPVTLGRGAVFLYEKTDDTWGSIASEQLFGEIDGERFGSSVDVTNRFAIVGAPEAVQDGTPTSTGAAYCYVLNDGNWGKLGPTIRGDESIFGTEEQFGYSVATSTVGRIVVGAPGSSLDSVMNRGRVYVYEFEQVSTSWALVYDGAAEEAGSALGTAVDMTSDGSRFVVGAPGQDFVEIYELEGSVWTMVQLLEGDSGEAFGMSVRVISPDGTRIAVGAPNHDSGKGRVVVYQQDSSGTFVPLGPSIVGVNGEGIGGTKALSGYGRSPSVVVATANGRVKRYDYESSGSKWIQSGNTVDSGFAEQFFALAAFESSMIVGGNNDVAFYELS